MNNITDRALEKLIENFHIPSSAAGNPEHMSFVMGDWNVTRKDFEKSSEDSIVHRSVFKPSQRKIRITEIMPDQENFEPVGVRPRLLRSKLRRDCERAAGNVAESHGPTKVAGNFLCRTCMELQGS